jgi:1-acyl-sn-glycerol-3-phosphate acyltransferase
LYSLIKLPIRLALQIFCVNKEIINPQLLQQKGPLLLVANHPNSFLDAIIIAVHFKEPIHFLARGDAFRKPWHNTLLRLLHMIPIYRISEGRGNLHKNEYAFHRSAELLKQNKIVLIFIEGICLQTHTLQPFKKGAARIALSLVREHLPLHIIPVSITYNSFASFGKNIRLHLSASIAAKELLQDQDEAKNFQKFNEQLYNELSAMIHIPQAFVSQHRILLAIPAMLGFFLHIPFYTLIKKQVYKKTKGTVFFDSVMFGVLLIVYPVYLILLTAFLCLFHIELSILLPMILLHPVLAWCAVQYKITRNNGL